MDFGKIENELGIENKENISEDFEEVKELLGNGEEEILLSDEEENLQQKSLDNFLQELEQLREDNTKNNSKHIKWIASFLVATIILTITIFSITMIKVNGYTADSLAQKERNDTKYMPYEESTIYFDKALELDEKAIVLEKLLLENEESILYFNTILDFDLYNITIIDNENKIYNINEYFTQNAGGYSLLKFAPISSDVKEILFKIESIDTKNYIEFKLVLKGLEATNPEKYIYDNIYNEFDDFDININYANITKNNSRVNYTIYPKEGADYEIAHGFLEKDAVILKEGDSEIVPLGEEPFKISHEGNILGRMDFAGVSNLEGDVTLKFNNIYKKYPINKTFSMEEINSGDTILNQSNYTLHLEGLHRFSDVFVLVYNTVDNNISTENRPENFNRLSTAIEAEIIVISNNGKEIIQPTKIKTSQIGTDLIFQIDGEIQEYIGNDIKINIKSLIIEQESVLVPLDLSRATDTKHQYLDIVKNKLSEGFFARINGDKSHKIFSENILEDEKLKSFYEQINTNKNIKPSITILYQKVDEEELSFILKEGIPITNGQVSSILYKTHFINALYKNGEVLVIDDFIIE